MNTFLFSKKQCLLFFYLLLSSLTINCQNDIFFSEYIEDGRNKCLELFNPTNKAIDLSDYTIEVYSDGSTSPIGTPWNFTGRTIGPMSVIVLCQGLSDIRLLSIRDYPFGFGSFNGDDAVVLKHDGRIIDVIGKVGCDPGEFWSGGGNKTEDVVLVRKACVDRGITNSGGGCSTFTGLASDWIAYSKIDYAHLGSHDFGAVEVEIFGKNALCEQTEITLSASEGFSTYRWSNGSNSATTKITAPGIYTVTVTTAENCETTASKMINGQSPELFAEIKEVKDVTCLPKSDGGFTVFPSGGDGSGNFTYEWETGSSTSAIVSGVAAGDYHVTVMDNNGCSVVKAVSIGGTTTFSMDVTPQGETCKGRGDGSINISVNGSGIQYSIDGATFQNTGFFDKVLPGSYNVLAIDNSGCGNQKNVYVEGGTRFDLRNSRIAQAKCQGEGGGQINLELQGGKKPYEVSFDGGPFTNQTVFSDLKGDTFDIVVRDGSGCVKSFEQIIEDGSDLLVTAIETIPATCKGIDDGVMNLTTTGGSMYVSINTKNADGNFSSTSFSRKFKDLAVGTHRLYAVDNMFGCVIPFDFEITEKAPLLTNIVNPTPCGDDERGVITVLPQTGMAPYQYSLDSGAFVDTNVFLDVAPIAHIVTTKDNLGCVKVDSVDFGAIVNFEIQSVIPTSESCVNTRDGQISILTNKTDSVQYSLDGMDYVDNPIFSDLASGDYFVYAKAGTCSDSLKVSILPADPISLISIEPKIGLCVGGNDGQLTINVSGGKSPYEYKLDNKPYQTNNAFTNLLQGTYTITVRDANLCEQIFTDIQLLDPVSLEAECVVIQHVSTKDGNEGIANIKAAGGTPPYNIQLVDAGFNNIVTATGSTSFENLPSGDYIVEIKDNNGCATTCNFTIKEPQCDFAIDKTQVNATCFDTLDGAISLVLPTENMPFTINWSDTQFTGQQHITRLGAGVYSVTVTDQAGCTDSLMVSITEPPALSVEIIVDNSTICEKDSALLRVPDAYTQYNWSTTSDSAKTSVYEEGTYQVTVRNEDGCVATDDIVINVIAQDTTTDIRFTCDESSVGTFTVEERGVDGCMDIVFRTFELVRKDTTRIMTVTCNSTDAGVVTNRLNNAFGCDSLVVITTILLDSDTTYQMNTTCHSDEVGIRRVVLTNAVGCDSTLIIETTLDEFIPQSFVTAFTCNDSEVGVDTMVLKTLTGCDSLVITQTISNASEPTNLTTTSCNVADKSIDTLFFTNQFLCDSLVIINTTVATNDLVFIDKESCNLQDTGLVIQNLANQFGCDSTVETRTTLSPINECRLGFSVVADTICWDDSRGTIQIAITEGIAPFDYFILNDFWRDTIQRGVILTTDTVTVLTNIPIGQYSIVLVNDRKVKNERRIALTKAKEMIIEGVLSDYAGFAVSCEAAADGSIDLNIINGKAPYTYLWADGTGTEYLQNLTIGNYEVTVTDANGCQQKTTFDLFSASEIQIDFQSFSPTCFGDVAGSITIYDLPNANGTVEYSLDGVLFQSMGALPFTIENLAPSDYQLFVQDENDCQASTLFSVPMPIDNQLTLGDAKNLILGDSLTLSPKANFEIERFEWSATVPLICEDCSEIKAIPTQNGVYTLAAYDVNGCQVIASTAVNLRKESQVYLPNAFSPNGDGRNDVYRVLTGNVVTTIKNLRIFDYEGRLMYQITNRPPNDVSIGWDGLFNGQEMLPAVFVVLVEVELLDGTSEIYRQTMTLVK